MSKTLKRILAMALVLCSVMSYTVPAANAAWWDDLFGGGSTTTAVTYKFDQTSYYTGIPEESDNTGILHYLLNGYTSTTDGTTVKTPMTQRYLAGGQNWTFEAASASLCGSTYDTEHLTNSNVRMLSAYGGLRISMGRTQNNWIAFRIKSPGAGTYTMKLDFYSYAGAPTVAFYILEAEGEASIDHDTVLARQERIQTEMDPNNRIGKVDQNAGDNGSKSNTAYIGSHTFEAGKEYILVAETYEVNPVASWYACFGSVVLTKDGTEGVELEGEREVGSILVEENVVPAADGGYMGAVQEVEGHDYFFLPLEGGKMAIYDLDKFIAGEEDYLVDMVTTGLYYPTHATVTDDGKVIVGGDGKRLFIFNTATMTGRTTPDFRATAGLEGEGHNSSSFYNTEDGLIYFGTAYGGHMARYNMDTKTYEDLGDMICQKIQELALGKSLSSDAVDNTGSVKAVACYGGYAYGLANSDRYNIIVKYDLTQKKVVGALDVTEQMASGANSWGMTVLGSKYIIVGAASSSGMALVDIASFSLVGINDVVNKGLFTSKSDAQTLWDEGVTGHATEVIDGKQYFFKNTKGMYSYDVNTGKMAYVGNGQGAFKTGAKTLVTLDRDKDGVEEQYLFSYAGGGQPRLFKPTEGKKISVNGLEADLSNAGGSSINIGDYYDDVLYIGAWNNWNCVAYDTGAEAIKSRYVTGGQTDSQVSYVDDDGTFHLVSGNYSACVVYEIDPDNKTTWDEDGDSNIQMALISNMKNYEQKRIHTVEGGDGYVFAGTIPTSYKNGGGVGVYNRATGTEDFIRFKETSVNGEKVVSNPELWDLSVQGLAYYDGLLYGTTSRSGGSGSSAVAGTSAQIFVMDYENMKIEATLDLRDYLTLVDADGDGVEDPISYVGGISVDEEGRFWGLCADVLFCFTYDKETKAFTVQEVLNLGHSKYTSSGTASLKNRKVVFDPENSQLFTSFYNYGMQQVVLEDWNAAVGEITVSSNTQVLTSAPYTYALGANNNLYYADGNNLYVKPVNVTDSDWTNAQAVDEMIKALAGDITVDSADDVVAAKAAYDSLSLRDKALVQETRAMKEAEAQVLELQIAAAIENVSAGSLGELGELIYKYNELEVDQQRYVQNFTALEEAYNTSVELVDNAAIVQEQINTLPDVVALTDEAAVVAARNAYTALTDEQKTLVDDTKLANAEAQIILLKAAGTVQEQINALPDSVALSDEAAVVAARSAYDALTDAQKATINTAKLEAAEAQIADLKAAKSVQAQINALPEEITLDNKAAVTAARKAYNALSAEGQAAVDTTKLVAAEARIAELTKAAAVQDQINALPETVAITDEIAITEARAAYEALTESQQANVDTTKLTEAEKALAALKKSTASKYTYDFKLYDNASYMQYVKDHFVAAGASEDFTVSNHHLYKYISGEIAIAALYKWFSANFGTVTNWALEGTDGAVYNNFGKDFNIMVAEQEGSRITFENTSAATKNDIAGIRLQVSESGTYKIDLSLFEGDDSKRLTTGDVLEVYILEAYEDYSPNTGNAEQMRAYLTEDNYVGSLTYIAQTNGTDTSTYTINQEYTFDTAGEYIFVIRESATDTCRYLYLDTLTLTEVISEEDIVATVGDASFVNLDDAFAYQLENDADAVTLVADAEARAVSLPENAVLDLNGKILTADVFDAVAPGAQVIDSTGGNGALVVAKGEDLFAEANAQLPVYDEAAGGYRFFEVSVKSVAITGKSSANPKYWFKISIENFEELYKLIQAGSELDIAVKMTWNGGEADAVAGAEFLLKWAEKYAAGGDFYITVSAVNTEDLEDFSLIPCMTANNVAICGDEL